MIQKLRLIQRAHRYRTRHDPAEIAHIRRLLSPGCVALDIGAHKGAYTYWLSRSVAPGGRVIAIEPQRELADRLVDLYHSRPGVEIRHGAVGSESGTVTLHIPGQGPSHGATIRGPESEQKSGGTVMRAVEVPCSTLEGLADVYGLTRLDLIKCDTEGAERDIFRAGAVVLERFRPAVLVECERRHHGDGSDPVAELWAIFRAQGYDGHCFCGGKLVPIAEFDYDTHQRDPDDKPNYGNNFLFTHPQGPAQAGG
ncbi:MAG: FkbM family methyltransferase [Phycisphaerales bacterium]